jgi:hypothetical protein
MAAEEGGFIKTTMLSAAVFFKPRRDENFREGSRGGEGRLNKGGRCCGYGCGCGCIALWVVADSGMGLRE